MQKKISIITINRNNATGLRQTIESVISQINDECEYLLIDGQSDDGSEEVIREFADYITYRASEPPRGVYAAMNQGIAHATGTYCLFLNSGDWLNTGSIAEAIRVCTGDDVIYFNTYLSYGNNRVEKERYPTELSMRSFFRRTIGHQSTLIKRELFTRYGLYNEGNKLYSDYEFWLKSIILGNVTCRYVDTFLSYYDMGGISTNPDKEASQEIAAILTKSLPERVLADYAYWHNQEREMAILIWYKNQKWAYPILVFIYKVIKNINRLFRT